ncbi:MAG TPA: arginase [Blastocatellia bacterium]|nr:arginase [Blastocatellia bacterium]HMV83377.1 arginase [Blastocatellia bacterium]HMX24242.1 arginase [Blastocatellia bacterium]HMZ18421.1 arginase [Blastocatellia bacterium]HNG28148.1 arginase [Blastocatellia bacterium]
MQTQKRKATVIGVLMDLGADRRGVDMGPSAVRVADLNERLGALGYEVTDAGNIPVRNPEMLPISDRTAKYLPEIATACQKLADQVEAALDAGSIPIVLGGDHSIAIGSVGGLSAFHRKRNEKVGVIWFDAHGDMNTPESSPSGNIHGMPFAAILGHGAQALTHISGFAPKVEPEDCVLIGARSVDPDEAVALRASGIRVVTMRELDERGMSAVMDEAMWLASRRTAGFHVTMDMDFVDPDYAPGVGTPVPGGPTYRESHLAMEKVADSGKMLSFELTEVNPVLDISNKTAELGVQLILSAFGKKIM